MQARARQYGAEVKADGLVRLLDHLTAVNLRSEAAGRRKSPLCIWGTHGIGKTEIVRDYARRKGYHLAFIAPAQFEEMGDLLGMPQIDSSGDAAVTTFRPPAWVPRKEGPGILLIDDVNRADDRILRGLMQLLEDYRLVSWTLPPKWQIVLTANPDEGDYSVTPMDEAMLTRMRHVTLAFDLKEWVRWASGAGVDGRGITFLQMFPDGMTGRRTTPRSLVQFFESIAAIEDLEAELPLVQALGKASLDEETVAAFVAFIQQKLYALAGPEDILTAMDFEREVLRPLQKAVDGPVVRVDILSALCQRLLRHLENGFSLSEEPVVGNLVAFLKMEMLPNDLRFQFVQELARRNHPLLPEILKDEELGGLLL